MSQIFAKFSQAIADGRLIGLATILAGPLAGRKLLIYPDGTTTGSIEEGLVNTEGLDVVIAAKAHERLISQKSERIQVAHGTETLDVFIEIHAPPPRLIVVGAVHIAIHLATMAKPLGFYTIVVDARSAFATTERFPHVDRLITQWPADALHELGIDESSCIVVLTHDEKLDNPALEVAVQSPARYIGALGSKKTHAKRVANLKNVGITDEQIARIHAPIGLDLGGRKPEEIAVSIIAQIVQVRNQG
ncbi:MAG: XdhC/CoxI family protein [Chloroflexota bacterium]